MISSQIDTSILNHMYPRTFPGNYKAGVYSLHFLTGEGKGVKKAKKRGGFQKKILLKKVIE